MDTAQFPRQSLPDDSTRAQADRRRATYETYLEFFHFAFAGADSDNAAAGDGR